MKAFIVFIVVSLLLIACESDNEPNNQFSAVSVSMGTNSAEDVYYSLENGVISSNDRTNWDIAFSVPLQTAAVLVNEGAGVELYCVGDTNYWSSVDANTIDSKEPRFNNESDWYSGAFNVNASGFPNYGWGTYHAGSPDHNVGGDSIYVIKFPNNTCKKFMIRAKMGQNSSNVFRWANLDGTNEQITAISTTPYFNKKNFIHFSLMHNEIKEIEPDQGNWDILFARYRVKVSSGPSAAMNYMVTGILSCPGLEVAKVTGVDPTEATEANIVSGYSASSDIIGYDWKYNDPVTHVTSLVEGVSYFIKKTDGRKYQIYFTEYRGLEDGTTSFKIRSVE